MNAVASRPVVQNKHLQCQKRASGNFPEALLYVLIILFSDLTRRKNYSSSSAGAWFSRAFMLRLIFLSSPLKSTTLAVDHLANCSGCRTASQRAHGRSGIHEAERLHPAQAQRMHRSRSFLLHVPVTTLPAAYLSAAVQPRILILKFQAQSDLGRH